MSKTLVNCILGTLLSQPITVQGNKLSNTHGRLCLGIMEERWFALPGAGQGLQKVACQTEIYPYITDTDVLLTW